MGNELGLGGSGGEPIKFDLAGLGVDTRLWPGATNVTEADDISSDVAGPAVDGSLYSDSPWSRPRPASTSEAAIIWPGSTETADTETPVNVDQVAKEPDNNETKDQHENSSFGLERVDASDDTALDPIIETEKSPQVGLESQSIMAALARISNADQTSLEQNIHNDEIRRGELRFILTLVDKLDELYKLWQVAQHERRFESQELATEGRSLISERDTVIMPALNNLGQLYRSSDNRIAELSGLRAELAQTQGDVGRIKGEISQELSRKAAVLRDQDEAIGRHKQARDSEVAAAQHQIDLYEEEQVKLQEAIAGLKGLESDLFNNRVVATASSMKEHGMDLKYGRPYEGTGVDLHPGESFEQILDEAAKLGYNPKDASTRHLEAKYVEILNRCTQTLGYQVARVTIPKHEKRLRDSFADIEKQEQYIKEVTAFYNDLINKCEQAKQQAIERYDERRQQLGRRLDTAYAQNAQNMEAYKTEQTAVKATRKDAADKLRDTGRQRVYNQQGIDEVIYRLERIADEAKGSNLVPTLAQSMAIQLGTGLKVDGLEVKEVLRQVQGKIDELKALPEAPAGVGSDEAEAVEVPDELGGAIRGAIEAGRQDSQQADGRRRRGIGGMLGRISGRR